MERIGMDDHVDTNLALHTRWMGGGIEIRFGLGNWEWLEGTWVVRLRLRLHIGIYHDKDL